MGMPVVNSSIVRRFRHKKPMTTVGFARSSAIGDRVYGRTPAATSRTVLPPVNFPPRFLADLYDLCTGKTLKRRLKRSRGEVVHGRPSRPVRFDDEVAVKAAWSPLRKKGGLKVRKLVISGANRLELHTSLEAASLYGLCMIAVLITFLMILPQQPLSVIFFLMIPAIAALFLAGGSMVLAATEPMVFDKIRGAFWQGRKKPDAVYARQRPGLCIRLDEIHALQILPKAGSDGTRHAGCEINLVLENGGRLHLTDRGNPDEARDCGETLSRFLEKPLWDATR